MADAFQEVHMPNGDVLQFPADMGDEDIKAAIGKYSAPGHFSNDELQNTGTPQATFLKGVPVLGAYVDQAGAAVSAAAHPLTGAGEQGGTFGERYAKNLDLEKRRGAQLEQQEPIGTTAGKMVAGGLATAPLVAAAPAAFGATGLGTAANMAGGAVGGATLGGADAYARGENPVTGAVLGGTIGGVAPAIARGVGAIAGKVMNAFHPTAPELQGINPQALDWATKVAKMDGLTDQEIQAQLQRLGPQGFLGEYGPNAREATGFVAARPGTGKTDIYNSLDQRAQEGRARVEQAVTDVAGPRQNMADVMAQSKEAQAQASNPLYERWRSTAVPLTQEMQDLIPRLQAAGAFQSAQTKMSIAGMPKAQGTAEWWDYVKRALDDGIERAQGRAPDDVRLLTQLKNDLVGSIDNHPNVGVANIWKQARETWADHESIMKARAGGQNLFDPRVRSDELAYKLQDYSAPEYQAHQEGVRDAIAQLMDHSTRGENEELRAAAFNRLMTPDGQTKLAMTYGDQGAASLAQAFKREMSFAGMYQDTLKNSKTAARSAVGEMMTPDPKDTLISRVRETYSPHVTPGVLIPRIFEKQAATRQAQQFEQARNAFAPIMLKQGDEAQRMARALIAHGQRQNYGGDTTYLANALLQSGAPSMRREMQGRLQ